MTSLQKTEDKGVSMGLGRKELVAGGVETRGAGTWEQVREGVRKLVGIVPRPRCSPE